MKIQSLSPVFQNRALIKNFSTRVNPYVDLTSKGDTVSFSGRKKPKTAAKNTFLDNLSADFSGNEDTDKILKKADKLLIKGEKLRRKANPDKLISNVSLIKKTKKGTDTFKYRITGSLEKAETTKTSKDGSLVTETFSYDFEGKLFSYKKEEICPDGEIKTKSMSFDEDGELM